MIMAESFQNRDKKLVSSGECGIKILEHEDQRAHRMNDKA
jgi:hypothetical protein